MSLVELSPVFAFSHEWVIDLCLLTSSGHFYFKGVALKKD